MKLYQLQSLINMKLALVLCIVIILSGCSTPVPVAVVCPPFPSPPTALMQPPPTQFLLDNALKPRFN